MATRKKKSDRRGSTFYGILIGLLLGLSAAAAVAYFVMSSPMPFVDKATREPASTRVDRVSPVDPNRGLNAASRPTAPVQEPKKDELAALISTLPVDADKPAPPLPKPPVVKPEPEKSAPSAQDKHVYFLQVGAFRVVEDAETLQARMIMMGLPVQIQRADVNGVLLNRVRVGPFSKLDDMNKVRARLSQEKIESNVIRQ
ncbi:SPOR domain-containing protein [Orrella sp. 11846]|uniref:SPOR domain-containing protein n=1 Tax=Orrella sp. 11846 TaxID=3409913 RepID=UPI003B5B654B